MGIFSWLKSKLGIGATSAATPEKDPEQKISAAERLRTREEPLFNPFGRFAEAVKTQVSERVIQYEEATQNEIRELLSTIAVIAFVGSSGTGKSTRAILIAKRYDIRYIIDDGLLIHGSSVIAGSSAKRAGTKLESVRQALFIDPTRAANMRRALVEHRPPTLMILGTSDGMLDRICDNLWLNRPSLQISIEDVTTEEERNIAKQTRLTEGKHTIPVPSMEIKHEFSGYFAEPLQKLRRRFDRGSSYTYGEGDPERTVVRPTFSSLGRYSMSDEAVEQLLKLIARTVPGIEDMVRYNLKKEPYGVILDLDLELEYGYNAQAVLLEAQAKISDTFERLTANNVLVTNVKALRVARLGTT
ncbi:MAG: hypothetical protein ACOYEL_00320 [Saccharofermentanales bacterium]|jgi:hypothetical protein